MTFKTAAELAVKKKENQKILQFEFRHCTIFWFSFFFHYSANSSKKASKNEWKSGYYCRAKRHC